MSLVTYNTSNYSYFYFKMNEAEKEFLKPKDDGVKSKWDFSDNKWIHIEKTFIEYISNTMWTRWNLNYKYSYFFFIATLCFLSPNIHN